MNFLRQSFAGLRILIVFTVVLGFAYPAVVWGIGQVATHDNANGSMVTSADGARVGSSLIGQEFSGDQWFQTRPSASDYDGLASGASNLGPNSPELSNAIEQRRAALEKANPEAVASGLTIPADAMTASASGLDPDISPEYALFQVDRVAKARGVDPAELRALVAAHTDGRELGFLGEPRVNVLELNLAVEKLAPGVTG